MWAFECHNMCGACPESENQSRTVTAQVMPTLSVKVSCFLYVKGNMCIAQVS
jgi:hypothetical protein